MRPDKYTGQSNKNENTGPIDSSKIRELTQNQKRQSLLNTKQKRKHEQRTTEIKNEPIRLDRLSRSFHYAFQGVRYVLRTQPNMKIHFIMAAIAVTMGFLFRISEAEWLALVLVIGFVIILEFINTAIETLVDLYTEDFSFLAGVSKDVGAATVLVMAFISVIVGLIIFLPKIVDLLIIWFD